ncbi:MAG: hypothetical protein OEV99_03790 [Nitrospira sp.]|nr:hypothetical protein [Nitrospira sp.]MDH4368943.1 hypothetical protein [Nitrospira sp.]
MIEDLKNCDIGMKAFKSKHRPHKRHVNGALCAELITRHTEYDATSIASRSRPQTASKTLVAEE